MVVADGDAGRRLRRLIGASAAVLAVAGFCAIQLKQAADAGRDGRQALVRAEAALGDGDLARARHDLGTAGAAFSTMRGDVRRLGPVLAVGRFVPFVRQQVRGIEAFTDAGGLVTESGVHLAEAADALLGPGAEDRPISSASDQLRTLGAGLDAGIVSLDRATERVAGLDGYRLVGPLASAQREMVRRLPRLTARARSARDGVRALVAFTAVDGRRSYLVFSQNPDEVRPTGGYIGTYGLLSANNGKLALDRYASIESWLDPRPQAAVPADQAPTAFRILDPPVRQLIANVNHTASWPDAARLANDLWQRGGEAPVDGVISFTPDFLARVLTVTGPVDVPGFGERVTSANLVERADYYTHLEGSLTGPSTERKRFIAALAEVVLRRLLDTPARDLDTLGRVVAAGLDAKEGMAWVADPDVARPLQERGWDGALPRTTGDFFFSAEFEYAAKNGRSLKRTFDHDVTIDADGSARITTRVTIANTAPPHVSANPDSLSYITVYGPAGAVLDPRSDRPDAAEPDMAGHPAGGWVRSAPPLGTTTLTVAWTATRLVEPPAGGRTEYRLDWLRLPSHAGDVLRLQVHLPPGWRWAGPAPPASIALDRDVHGVWPIETAR